MKRSNGLITFVALLLVFGGFGYLIYNNTQPAQPLRAVIPTQVEPTAQVNTWQEVLQQGFGTTPLAPIDLPAETFAAPTLASNSGPSATPFAASTLSNPELFTLEPVSVGATPTPPQLALPATPVAETGSGDGESLDTEDIPEQQVAVAPTIPWQPPALSVPQNRDPLGRDHYWLARPVGSNGRNFGTSYYPYGSDGRGEISASLIHHGIDMQNPVGTTVRAAQSGTVMFASSEEDPFFQGTGSYGVAVVIEHDISFDGLPVVTLYAHMQAALVETGDVVQMGDAIGVIGNTGRATGPHVHFEVRLGEQPRYGDTYNPLLWMVPYEGHGTIAGRFMDVRGNFVDDVNITLKNWATGLVESSTSTYIFENTVNDVNVDPNWQENFVFGDVPVGRYEVVTNHEGVLISEIVDVEEGLTTFVELQPSTPATAQPVEVADGP